MSTSITDEDKLDRSNHCAKLVEEAERDKIVSNLWYLSRITENIDALIQACGDLWSEQEENFLLNVKNPTEKSTIFYSKIASANSKKHLRRLMAALRETGNSNAAEIVAKEHFFGEEEDTDSSEHLTQNLQTPPRETDDDNLECIEFDITTSTNNTSLLNGESKASTPSLPMSCTYKLSGLTEVPASKFGQFGPKIPLQKILKPQGIFISESFYQRITTLQLSDFITTLPNLVAALQNCAVVENFELKNVFYELLPAQKGNIDPGILSGKLWLPKLKTFKFEAKSLANTSYSSEGYTWDMIFFVEVNKGNPLTMRNIWQGRSLNVSVTTMSLELELDHEKSRVDFTLHRRHFHNLPIIPDYFLDSFLRNCTKLQELRLILPEVCAKLDYDCLPKELSKLQLTGFVLLGSFSMSRPVKELVCINCRFPEIFLSELHFIFPMAQSIKLISCVRDGSEHANGSSINLEVTMDR